MHEMQWLSGVKVLVDGQQPLGHQRLHQEQQERVQEHRDRVKKAHPVGFTVNRQLVLRFPEFRKFVLYIPHDKTLQH